MWQANTGGNMTIKKYLEDPYKDAFDGLITQITTYKNQSAIIMTETYFYPEGGGQPSDQGTIGPIKIIDVQIEDGIIYHLINEDQDLNLIEINQTYPCKLDFERRFNLMQQHAGQHLLSSTVYNTYQANTVGFHIGDDYITIDLDKSLTQTQIDHLEREANRAILDHKEIKAFYPDEETLLALPLRKRPKVSTDIRVIEIADQDFSPCGGTHPKSTSEIGLIKIKKFEKYKSGIRITFICGLKALDYMQEVQKQTIELSKLLAKPELNLLEGVQHIIDKGKEDRKVIDQLEDQIAFSHVKSIQTSLEVDHAPHFILDLDQDRSPSQTKKFVESLLKMDDFILLSANTQEDGVQFYLGMSKNLKDALSIKDIFEVMKKEYDLRGGGSPFLIQFKMSKGDKTDLVFEAIESAVNSSLMAL